MHYFYPEDLPVSAHRDAIRTALAKHQVIVVAGDTGSGKTTQLPKLCLEVLGDTAGMVGCTQPRRIAATSVAGRVAEELGEEGHIVGYKIRFHDHTSAATRIKFMTDGVLLAETKNDPLLKKYAAIILDEAHERSLNVDFLLGYIKKILPERPELKIIITSATIDTEAFSKHFDNAPVISVEGRTYPVEVHYAPLQNESDDEAKSSIEHCAAVIEDILRTQPPGDILAFLATEKDIRACCELLTSANNNAVILPLFGRLQGGDQKKIFQHYPKTKIVVATNVAETSITVPGIRYVVDSGLARISYYNARAKTTSLPVKKISQAACEQRKGRCGRVGPGICIRLYEEEDFLNREQFTLPEIKRANLADVILQMIRLELGRPEDFPFIDPPLRTAIRDGYKLLFELGAIGHDNRITAIGNTMAGFPIDPCISRILIEAQRENCLKEIMIIAAALAVQDPRVRPAEKEKDADTVHQKFAHPHSDFMVYLNLWNDFHDHAGKKASWSKLKKYCKNHFLSFQRMREWFDLHDQLCRIVSRSNAFTENNDDPSYQQIHRALASGFLRNIATKKRERIYQNGQNQELVIFPASHQYLSGGKWIMAASFLETNRLYALTVASIEPDWLEPLATHLVKYSWSNPRWQKKTGRVLADEKVSLFGLILVAARTVNFPQRNKKNRPEARKIFIQTALVERELQGNYRFLASNAALIDSWRKKEEKLRATTILQDESTLFAFYDERLPEQVCDRASLNRFLKRKGHSGLIMREEHILLQRPEERTLADFPDTLTPGELTLDATYAFTPGSDDDGITIHIPALSAEALNPHYFAWLVPGLLKEKITFLCKGLPKKLRKHLVPVNVAVDRIMDDVNIYKGSLWHALEASIHKLFSIQIRRSDWPKELPAHLTPRFALYDTDGSEICAGRDLRALIGTTRQKVDHTENIRTALRIGESDLVKKWQAISTRDHIFDDLPKQVELTGPEGQSLGFLYPFLVAQPNQGKVTIDFTADRQEARNNMQNGLEFFYRLQCGSGYTALQKYLTSLISGPSVLLFVTARKNSTARLKKQLSSFIMRSLFPSIGGIIPEKKIFTEELKEIQHRGFYREGQQIADHAIQLLRKRAEIIKKFNHFRSLDKQRILFTAEKNAEFSDLLHAIIPENYYQKHTAKDIEDTDRQLRCFELRLERYYSNPAKDAQKTAQLQPHLDNYSKIIAKSNDLSEEAQEQLDYYRFLIDEFRISLFAPEIKTRIAISSKKLHRQLKKITHL